MDKSDILFYFIEKAIKLCKNNIGFIISNSFLFSAKAVELRNYILDNAPIDTIVNFENYKVFKAGISTCIILLDKNKKDTNANAFILPNEKYTKSKILKIIENPDNSIKLKLNHNDNFPLIDENKQMLNNKIDGDYSKLGDLFLIGKGMETSADKVYQFKEYPKQFPKEYIKTRVTGSNLSKYYINPKSNYVLYFEDITDFKELPTSIKKYLKSKKKVLSNRADKKRRKTSLWWNYTFSLHKEQYFLPKIFCSRRAKDNIFALDDGFYYLPFSNMTVIFGNNEKINLKYVLTLLNSNILTYRYKSIGKLTGGGSYEYFPNGLSKIPIPEITLEDQQQFIELADKIINLKEDLSRANTPNEKRLMMDQISIIDNKINDLVYKLYDLTPEEIEIVENNIKE